METPPKPQRTPVRLTQREWVQSPTLRMMGVDPGLASMGVVVLEQRAQEIPLVLAATLVRTQKATKKERTHLRVSADDKRRYSEIWRVLWETAEQFNIHGVGVETYDTFVRQSAAAMKCAAVYGMVMGFSFARNIVAFPFRPGDLKKGVTGKLNSSKEDVRAALAGKVINLESFLQKIPEGELEHVGDAAGHALLALREMHEMRKMLGVVMP